MRERISRRDFLRWGAVAMGGAALASCAPQAALRGPAAEKEAERAVEAQPAPAEGVTVTWWYAWGKPSACHRPHGRNRRVQTGCRAYLEHKGSVTSEAILTAVAAGTPPDGGSKLFVSELLEPRGGAGSE